ncbi:MAG: peptidyl-prolyl cis-trans isomerase [Lachnospiraceae bacterium]|jgi:parvulin-like peptidyl-prolyl isomerase|nr:peptidyl-prolyl cis-trans isomerase [Lachnospiraceae bacterium]
MKRRLLALVLSGVLVLGTLTGCTIKSDDVVLTMGKTEVKGDVANFFARYSQAQTNQMYAYYAQMGYGSADVDWSAQAEGSDTKKKSDDKTYEEQTKETALKNLETFIVLSDHAKDKEYNVKISDKDKKAIEKAAAAFVKANKNKDGYKKISGDKKVVEQVLTWMTIQSRMQKKIEAKADTKVTDKEAAQKKMQYVEFSYSTSDSSSSSDTADAAASVATDTVKKQQKEAADNFYAALKKDSKADFSALAKKQGLTAQDATFDKDSTTPNEDLVKAADKLKVGEYTKVIETDDGLYVAKLTSLMDKDATKSKKESIVSDRKQKLYDDTVDKWIKAAKPDVNKGNWKKIKFTDFNVKAYQKPTDTSSSSSSGTTNVTTTTK